MVTMEHRMKWFARVPPCQEYPDGYIPRNGSMRKRDWGWDVRCSCGWESRTGGAIEASVKRDIEQHRWEADADAEMARQEVLRARRLVRWEARSQVRKKFLESACTPTGRGC